MGLTVVVLGMHRSGTSCVTRMLNLCGMYLGDDLLAAPNISNMEGKWEAREAVEINDHILAASGGSWDCVPSRLHLPPDSEKRMRQFLDQLQISRVAGWKDPRTVITFPLWQPLLSDYRIVACLRHPQNVAESLATREGWPVEKGLDLWLAYNKRLLQHLENEPQVIWFDFDDHPDHVGQWLSQACLKLGLRYDESAARSFNRFQRHHDHSQLPSDRRIRTLYQDLWYRAHWEQIRRRNVSMATPNPNSSLSADGEEADGQTTPSLATGATGPEQPKPTTLAFLEQQISDLTRVLQKQNALTQHYFKSSQESGQRIRGLEARLEPVLHGDPPKLQQRVEKLQRHLGDLHHRQQEQARLLQALDARTQQTHTRLDHHQGQMEAISNQQNQLHDRFQELEARTNDLCEVVKRLEARTTACWSLLIRYRLSPRARWLKGLIESVRRCFGGTRHGLRGPHRERSPQRSPADPSHPEHTS